jgi:hypothetical protein
MEEKVMYNVLKTIARDKCAGNSAPHPTYVKSLADVGIVDDGWDTTLTSLGIFILGSLSNKFEKW